jgi:hypothetical protein
MTNNRTSENEKLQDMAILDKLIPWNKYKTYTNVCTDELSGCRDSEKMMSDSFGIL